MHMHSDVLIVGAGPAGLSLAISLAKAGFTATVLDQNPTAALEQPAPDGREIALTHPSVATLQRLGSWAGLAASEMGHIRAAHVHDGPVGAHSAMQLQVAHGAGAAPAPSMPLGFIVPNHALRRTAYGVAASTPGVRMVRKCTGWPPCLRTQKSITPTLPPPARPASACAHRWWWRPTAAFLPHAASWALAPR